MPTSAVQARARELDVLSQAVIATDLSGTIIHWNAAAEELYGWSREEAIGRPITEITPAPHSREEAMRIMELLRSGRHWSGEFPVHRKDGRTFVAHVVDAPVLDDSGALVGIIGVSSDIAPVIRLQRLARDLSASLTPESVAKVGLTACLDVCGGAAGWFMTLDSTGERLELLYATGYPAETVQRFRSVPMTAQLPIVAAARQTAPLFITSRDEWNREFQNVTDPRTRAWVSLPLAIGDRVVGAIGISIRITRAIDANERALLVAMSQHAAVAVERAQLFIRERAARGEAEEARARAEEANRVKSAFLVNMSHELRTPLGAIIGYHDLLAEEVFGPITEQQRIHLLRSRNSATHLLALIDDLLSFSRIEAAREVVRPEPTDIVGLTRSVADIVEPLARTKGLDFMTLVPATETIVHTDPKKLKQIMVNLAANAVKYTERGSVCVECDVDADRLRVVVSDTGVGIRAEHLESVFEPFWRAETGHDRTHSGTGLGLSVSRSLATLLGGAIQVTSEVGKGSTFILDLPLRPQLPSP